MNAIKFAVIGDCHYSKKGNYSTRDCLGAKKQLQKILDELNKHKLDFVLSIGDIGNGDDPCEVSEMLEVYATSANPVKFVIGNHDLVQHSDEEFASLVGMPSPFYQFDINNYRFIVLNAMEHKGKGCPEGSEKRQFYKDFVKENAHLKIQPWPGVFSEQTWQWLESNLSDALDKEMNVILFSHVPAVGFAEGEPARLPEHIRMAELLDKFPNVRAYIAGHCHGGGMTVRKGVMHKTMRSVCDNTEPTACICVADENEISVEGMGNETDFTHKFKMESVVISGSAPENSYVMTNCGEIVRVGKSCTFALTVPCPGVYSIKAVMDGCEDCYVPMIQAPASGIDIKFKSNPLRKLYTGYTKGCKTLLITEDGKPVHWFDLAGTQYGSVVPKEKVWYAINNSFWTNGTYAFTAEGEVNIRIIPQHKQLKDFGWYKGDLHAHLFHGESHYFGNVQSMGFIGKAEGYDWLYVASRHETEYGNDGYPTDAETLALKLSDENFLYRINEEFPKSRSNHFGNCCVNPIGETVDYTKISSMEIAKKHVWDRGGVTVPVHPFYDHMCFRELCLWILCAPEMMPCMDFYYSDAFPKHLSEDYWFMLLNRGYEIGCFATSDASYDVGRTPGNRGATYLHMDSLCEESIKQAILNKRSMVSYDSAAILFSIDDSISGDKIIADGTEHKLSVRVLWQKDRNGVLRIIRSGKDVFTKLVAFNEDEKVITVDLNISETDNCWYAVILENYDKKIRSVASPVYFRNDSFVPPRVMKLKKAIPPEIIARCEELTYEDIARPELIEEFEQLLIKMDVADYD